MPKKANVAPPFLARFARPNAIKVRRIGLMRPATKRLVSSSAWRFLNGGLAALRTAPNREAKRCTAVTPTRVVHVASRVKHGSTSRILKRYGI